MNRATGFVIGILIVLSVGIAVALLPLLPILPPVGHMLLVLVVLGLLLLLFDFWLWRFPLWRSIGLVCVPYIDGQWTGKLTTSFDGQNRLENVRLVIYQRWTKISIQFFSETSISTSISAATLRRDTGEEVLTYVYSSEPVETATPDIVPHIGLTVLRLLDTGQLSGYYHYFYYDEQKLALVRGQLVFTRMKGEVMPDALL